MQRRPTRCSWRKAIPAALALLAAGCAGSEVQRISFETFPRTDPESVRVLTAEPPRNAYVEVARLKAENDNGQGVDRIKREAAKLGADAVVLQGEESGGPQSRFDIGMNAAGPVVRHDHQGHEVPGQFSAARRLDQVV